MNASSTSWTATPPLLYTSRLTLRPFVLSDAAVVQTLAGDRDVAARTLSIPHPYEDGMAEAWIESHAALFAEARMVNLAIVERESNHLCGSIGLSLELEHHRAELGYWVGKPFWGQGYCTEAARAILDYGFSVIQLHRVIAKHFTTNPASGRVMQKLGMQHEGCLRQHTYKWDHYEDVMVYGLLKSDMPLNYAVNSCRST